MWILKKGRLYVISLSINYTICIYYNICKPHIATFPSIYILWIYIDNTTDIPHFLSCKYVFFSLWKWGSLVFYLKWKNKKQNNEHPSSLIQMNGPKTTHHMVAYVVLGGLPKAVRSCKSTKCFWLLIPEITEPKNK